MLPTKLTYSFELFCADCDEPLQGEIRQIGTLDSELLVNPCEKCMTDASKEYEN